jgi:hypothetical protein
MNMRIAEVIEKLKAAKSKAERVELLKNNDSLALRGILRMNYDKSLVLSLPEGVPIFKKSVVPEGMGDTTLKTSAKGWYVFVESLAPNMKQHKREQMFIGLLERLDSKEADILISAKDRKLEIGLTKKVINEAFPGLIIES